MARKPEQLVWDRLRAAAGSRILFQRHEDKLCSGIPDLSGVFQGVQFWCELKAEGAGGRLKIRQSQLNWMLRRSQSGILCILAVGRTDKTWAVCPIDYNTHRFLSESQHADTVDQNGYGGADIMGIIADLVSAYQGKTALHV